MALNKPYYRIFRPGIKHNAFDNSTGGYERDIMFLPEAERRSMIMAARLIMDDFSLSISRRRKVRLCMG